MYTGKSLLAKVCWSKGLWSITAPGCLNNHAANLDAVATYCARGEAASGVLNSSNLLEGSSGVSKAITFQHKPRCVCGAWQDTPFPQLKPEVKVRNQFPVSDK